MHEEMLNIPSHKGNANENHVTALLICMKYLISTPQTLQCHQKQGTYEKFTQI
jgi:hypothetical protein